MTINVLGYGTHAATTLASYRFERDLRTNDVEIEIFILRRVPFRFAHGPQRLGFQHLSGGSRPRNHRSRQPGAAPM